MSLVFQDTFTDTNGVLIGPAGAGHSPNLGAVDAYFGNTQDATLNVSTVISTNKARGSIGPFTGASFSDFHTLAIATLSASPSGIKEIIADIFPIVSVSGSIVEILFQYQTNISPLASTGAEYYAIHLRRSATVGQWDVYASYGPYQSGIVPSPYIGSAPIFSPKLATVAMTDGGAGLRFGATRYQTTRLYDFWYEPAGGGTRTFIGSFTFPEYADSNHKGFGIAYTGPGASTTTVDFDNLGGDSTGTGSTPAPPTTPKKTVERLFGYSSLSASQPLLIGNFGNTTSFGGTGSVVMTVGYQAAIGYSCRKIASTGSGVTGRFDNSYAQPQIQAAFMFAPFSSCKRLYRIRDVVMFRVTQVGGGSPNPRAFWGLFKVFAADTKDMDDGWIGFYTKWVAGAPANWFAKVGNDAETVLFSQDTGIQSDSPHQLTIEIDGFNGVIKFYVDGIVKATYTVVSGQLGGLSLTGVVNLGLNVHAAFVSGASTIVEGYHAAYGMPALITDETEAAA